MNTIDDLRATLQHHAADLPDELDHARSASVHQRVRVARQRRRAVVAGGIASALAVTVGGVGLAALVSHRSSELRPLAGHTPPARMTSLGFGYSFVEGKAGDGTVTIDFDASDSPRLVSWAGSSAGAVEVEVRDQQIGDASDFSSFTTISPGETGPVTVTGRGKVALAVYRLDTLAPGVTGDGSVFRDEVAGDSLLGAAFGDASHPVRLQVSSPTGRLRLASTCRHAPSGTWLTVEVDGEMTTSGECYGDHGDVDAGVGGGTFDIDTGTHTVTSRLTQGMDGPAVEAAPGLEFGVGVYAAARPVTADSPFQMDPQIEYDGHVWAWSRSSAACWVMTRPSGPLTAMSITSPLRPPKAKP